jgi:hypothetical protein
MVHVAETKNQISHVTQKSISRINVGALFGSCKSLFMMNPQQSSLTSPCALDNIIVFASHGQTRFVCTVRDPSAWNDSFSGIRLTSSSGAARTLSWPCRLIVVLSCVDGLTTTFCGAVFSGAEILCD